MHGDETRALRRALLILLATSAARWGWGARRTAGADRGAAELPALLDGTREATDEDARRRAPLGEGETVDPNRAGEVDLDRLPGVGPSTARAVVAARDSGAVFRRPEDLLGVRGIGPATLERIRPWLTFSSPPPGRPRAPRTPSPPPADALLDLNRADRAALEGLPGIGPAIAARILSARQERMFTSWEDLERVPGIGSATLERLRPHATVRPPP